MRASLLVFVQKGAPGDELEGFPIFLVSFGSVRFAACIPIIPRITAFFSAGFILNFVFLPGLKSQGFQ